MEVMISTLRWVLWLFQIFTSYTLWWLESEMASMGTIPCHRGAVWGVGKTIGSWAWLAEGFWGLQPGAVSGPLYLPCDRNKQQPQSPITWTLPWLSMNCNPSETVSQHNPSSLKLVLWSILLQHKKHNEYNTKSNSEKEGARQMDRWLRALTRLVWELVSVPSTHVMDHNNL